MYAFPTNVHFVALREHAYFGYASCSVYTTENTVVHINTVTCCTKLFMSGYACNQQILLIISSPSVLDSSCCPYYSVAEIFVYLWQLPA